MEIFSRCRRRQRIPWLLVLVLLIDRNRKRLQDCDDLLSRIIIFISWKIFVVINVSFFTIEINTVPSESWVICFFGEQKWQLQSHLVRRFFPRQIWCTCFAAFQITMDFLLHSQSTFVMYNPHSQSVITIVMHAHFWIYVPDWDDHRHLTGVKTSSEQALGSIIQDKFWTISR